MKCFWIFFHKWTKYGNLKIDKDKIPYQQKHCEKCNAVVIRLPNIIKGN